MQKGNGMEGEEAGSLVQGKKEVLMKREDGAYSLLFVEEKRCGRPDMAGNTAEKCHRIT